jgi:hypothetical protein
MKELGTAERFNKLQDREASPVSVWTHINPIMTISCSVISFK